jgi:hypothetical protein
MANPYGWLKLHTEARSDNKLRALSDAEHRVWFNCLCMAGEQRGDLRGSFPLENMALLALEVSDGDAALLEQTLTHMETLNMGGKQDGRWWFRRWKDRQYDYPSDAPEQTRERQRRHRERQSQSDVTNCHEPSRLEQNRTESYAEQTPPLPPLRGEAPCGAAGPSVCGEESPNPESDTARRASERAGVGEMGRPESQGETRDKRAGTVAPEGSHARMTVRRGATRHKIPPDWTPGDGMWAKALETFAGVTEPQLARHAVEFRDWWLADGRPKASWDLTWWNRLKAQDPRTIDGARRGK